MRKTVQEEYEEMSSIHLEGLENAYHREFVNDTLINAQQCEAVVQNLPTQLQALKEAYDEELEASLLMDTIQILTAEVESANGKRALAQTALKSAYRAAMGMTELEKVGAAAIMFELMHKYDLHSGMNFDKQTAIIDSFITDVEQNYLQYVELTGTTELYESLKAWNQRVCDKVIERDRARVGLGVGRMQEARGVTDRSWRELRTGVNAFAYVHGYAAYAQFIGYMNVLIIRYKREYLKQTVSSPEAGSGAEAPGVSEGTPSAPGTPEDTPSTPNTPSTPDTPSEGQTMHTVNWVNKDGETVKTMQVAAGTKLTSSDYPKASSGYVWKPSWIGGGLPSTATQQYARNWMTTSAYDSHTAMA